jgi:hypothetical protein
MKMIQRGYEGFELLVELNLDRMFVLTALGAALWLGAYFGTS